MPSVGRTSFSQSSLIVLLSATLLPILAIIGVSRAFGIDPDYSAYQRYFSLMMTGRDFSQFRFEPLFLYYTYGISVITLGSFNGFLAITIIASTFGKFYFFLSNSRAIFLLGCYLVSFFLLHEMVQLRLGLAITSILCGIKFLQKDMRALALIACAIGGGLHYSVVPAAVILCAPPSAFNKKIIIPLLVFFSALALQISGDIVESFRVINPLSSFYISESDYRSVNVFNALSLACVFLWFLWVGDARYFSKLHSALFLIVCSYFLVYLFAVFVNIPALAQRVLQLTFLFSVVFAACYSLRSPIKDFFQYSIIGLTCGYMFLRNIFLYPLFT